MPQDLDSRLPGSGRMEMEKTLLSLGAAKDTLTPDETSFLDRNGYLLLEDVLSAEEVRAFAARVDELALIEGERAGVEVHQEEGTTRLSNLIDKDPMFEKCVTQPRVLASIRHVLGAQFKLSSLNARSALPGAGQQRLHTDWHEAVPSGDFQVCNSIWLLDDFTADNGATRIVPGTQKHNQRPCDAMDDANEDHPDQVLMTAKAGSVVTFNSHVWHGGALNQTNAPRRALHCYFCRRQNTQQTDQRKYLRQETIERLSARARVILDVVDT